MDTRICDRCARRKPDIEFPLVEGRRSTTCWACAQPADQARQPTSAERAGHEDEAAWAEFRLIFGYPFGVFLLVAVELGATVGERGCSRFGDCPGGLLDVFIVAMRALNGGPPSLIEWVITLGAVVGLAWVGWRRLGAISRPIARLERRLGEALERIVLGRAARAPRPPTRHLRIRLLAPGEQPLVQRPGRVRFAVFFVAGLFVWLAFASVGVMTPWLVALAVLVAVP